MASNHKITIPNPCHKDWNKMTPKDNGRFCLSCSKTVVDFTKMLPEEIQQYFKSNQNASICGRFKKSQLDQITIEIPSRVLYTQTNYHKMFLLALFIAMGTTLFSCTDKNGDKQKIDKIEVTQQQEYAITGLALPPKHLQEEASSSSPQSVNHFKSIKSVSNKNTDKVKLKKPPTINCGETTEKAEDVIYNGYVAIEKDPEYNDGIEEFYTFFKNKYQLPEEAKTKSGEIEISFVVDQNGSLEDIKPIKDFGFGTMEEAIRILKSSQKWKPGEQNGKKTRARYLLSIQIQKNTLNNNISTITAIHIVKD